MLFTESIRQKFFVGLLFFVMSGLALAALIIPSPLRPSISSLEVGQVAPQDIVAPKAISYESAVLTANQRDAAARVVTPVYAPLDTDVARRQVSRLRNALDYISSVRADQYATSEQKLADLTALEDFKFQKGSDVKILALSDARWQTVQQETINVLEQVMRSIIRENRLEEARRSVPALVSLSLPEEQAAVVAELAVAFVAPNSLYSEALTELARQQASKDAQPVIRSYVAGETVVSGGKVINDADIEALQELGLTQPEKQWQDYIGAAGLVIVIMAFLVLYLSRRPRLRQDPRAILLIAILFLVFLYIARLGVPEGGFVPYMIPLSAFSIVLASLFNNELALIAILALALLVTYDLPGALGLTMFHTVGAMFGVFSLGEARRVFAFLRASAISAFTGGAVAFAYLFPEVKSGWGDPVNLAGAIIVNGIASAGLTLVIQYFLAQALGMISSLQLNDLTRPDHPLLRLLMRASPGTYQHSLQVANLAEQAAESVDADALLTRVGALYHDIGKTRNPGYFIENQIPGQLNPHDELDPITSAAIIIRHVEDGVEQAREHRLPLRIQDFILEHHGTALTRYQYIHAVKAAGGDESLVTKANFYYPGPRPQSRETSIVMLADGCEAATRARRPRDEAEIRVIIQGIFVNRQQENQLDDTSLTFNDLIKIQAAFLETQKGIYHPRIEYPKLEAAEGMSQAPSDHEAAIQVKLPGQEAPLQVPNDHNLEIDRR